MGGTFDPVHHGHLVAASEVAARFGLDEVVFVPTGQPWQKADRDVSPAEDRYLMTVIATASDPRFSVSRVEVDRDGPTYTVETLRALRAEHGGDAALFFIIGADALAQIVTWHDADELFALAHFVGVTRPGYVLEWLPDGVPAEGRSRCWRCRRWRSAPATAAPGWPPASRWPTWCPTGSPLRRRARPLRRVDGVSKSRRLPPDAEPYRDRTRRPRRAEGTPVDDPTPAPAPSPDPAPAPPGPRGAGRRAGAGVLRPGRGPPLERDRPRAAPVVRACPPAARWRRRRPPRGHPAGPASPAAGRVALVVVVVAVVVVLTRRDDAGPAAPDAVGRTQHTLLLQVRAADGREAVAAALLADDPSAPATRNRA